MSRGNRRFDPEGQFLWQSDIPIPRLIAGDELSAYERGNKQRYEASGGHVGMPIALIPNGVFWSRGWRGCPQCGGHVGTHRATKPYEIREGGILRAGFSCTGAPGMWAE